MDVVVSNLSSLVASYTSDLELQKVEIQKYQQTQTKEAPRKNLLSEDQRDPYQDRKFLDNEHFLDIETS